MFFMLFLAGLAFVNLRGMQDQSTNTVLSPEILTSSAWRPARLAEMKLDEDTQMYVQFDSDGQVSGHAGCNRFFGSYDLNDEKMEIGPLGATRMACPEPAMSFELSFLEALQSTATAALANGRLALKNDRGDTIVLMVSVSTPPADN